MKNFNQQRQTTGKSNFIKYLNPSTLIQPKAQRNRTEMSNIHCRSMQELDFNANAIYNSSIARENLKTNIHHSSLFSDKHSQKADQEPGKSKSLSKFIAFFQNSNLLNPNQVNQVKQVKQESKDLKRNNYNGFSYDLKISSNSSAANNKKILKKKDKENINYQTLNSQRQLSTVTQNKENIANRNENNNQNKNAGNQAQEILLSKMKEVIEEQKRRQVKYCEKISDLQAKNQQLLSERQKLMGQIENFSKKIYQSEDKIKQLEGRNKELQQKNRYLANRESKSSNKQSREQDIVIKSLKKVINQQLNKIIELERVKIENEYLKEKLGHEENRTQSDSSFSHHDYSFEYEHDQKKKKSPSSLSSSFKPESQLSHDYGKQNFRKSKPSNQNQHQNQTENSNGTHFKSFFQIQESPISADGHLKRFFKISESNNKQGKKEVIKTKDQKQGPSMIKIIQAESSFSRQAIEQVNEENEQNELRSQRQKRKFNNHEKEKQSNIRQVEDSILQQVDEYLTKWRNKP